MTNILWFVGFEVAYFLAYRYGMLFTQALPSPFWFPDSVLLCALLKTRPRTWWIFILGALPIRLFSPVAEGIPFWFLLGAATVNFTTTWLMVVLLRRFMPNATRFDTIRDLIVFVAVAVVAAPAFAAFSGAALRESRGYEYWQSWERWFLGNALAQLVITPAILYLLPDPISRARRLTRTQIFEACAVFAALFLTTYFATHLQGHATEAAYYLPVPFLFWAAIRFGMPGAAAGIVVISFFAVDAALDARGIFAGRSPGDIGFALQTGLLLRAASLYLVAVAVEQERTAQRALRESEGRFRMLAESTPVLVWMTGPDKLCEYFNIAWVEFTGRTVEQAMGFGWSESVHVDDVANVLAQYEAAFDARQPFEIDFRLRRHDGEYRWIAAFGTPRYGPDGDFAGYIGSSIDITDRRRAEEDHRALAHAQRLAVVGELTAALAHEIKQPLAAIALNSESLKIMVNAANLPIDDIREVASDILGNVQRTDSVMNLIRTFVRLPETNLERLAANDIVSDVLQLAGRDATRRGVRIRTDLAVGLPPVAGDRTQLQQVLLNLVMNAIDAMQGIPQPERRLILRTCETAGGEVEISVTDCGHGIPPALMPHLFDSFFTTKPEGMGLGLAIARSIALAHRGDIRAEPDLIRGATFRVTLPVAKAGKDAIG